MFVYQTCIYQKMSRIFKRCSQRLISFVFSASLFMFVLVLANQLVMNALQPYNVIFKDFWRKWLVCTRTNKSWFCFCLILEIRFHRRMEVWVSQQRKYCCKCFEIAFHPRKFKQRPCPVLFSTQTSNEGYYGFSHSFSDLGINDCV